MKKLIFSLVFLSLLTGVIVAVVTPSHMNSPKRAEQSKSKIIPLPTARQVETDINQFRASKHLPVLADNAALDKAAQVRANNMCAENNWSHKNDWTVLSHYYLYSYAGENLYYGSLQDDQAAKAVKAWSLSPEHLRNMIGGYTQIGVAVKLCPGFQDNTTAVLITNYFGVPQ